MVRCALQVARNFEHHANKEKAKHGEEHMSDPMPLTKMHRVLPADASDPWREDFLEPAPKTSNALAAGMDKHTARKLRQVKSANTK